MCRSVIVSGTLPEARAAISRCNTAVFHKQHYLTVSRLNVSDVDEASQKISELLSADRPAPGLLEVYRMVPAHMLKLDGSSENEPTISSEYDSILQTFIASLPKSVSARIRQEKETIARRIATEVMLASTSIRSVKPNLHQPAELHQTSASRQGEPATFVIPPFKSLDYGKAIKSSPPVPVSSQINPPSSMVSNQAPITQSTAMRPDNPITFLSQYLTVDKEAPSVGANVQKVLGHWAIGEDPSNYNWDQMTQEVVEQFEDQQVVQARREKTKRKAERLAKRQKKEDEIFMGKSFFDTQPAQRSSPGPLPHSSQTQSQSQTTFFGGLPGMASQAEPGRHGGRPMATKKKKKSRMSGF